MKKISDLTKIRKKNAHSYLKKISDSKKKLRSHKNKKKCRSLKKRQKFGRFRINNRVGFVGWMVGWLDGKEIFEYTPDRNEPKTRATRGQASLRTELYNYRRFHAKSAPPLTLFSALNMGGGT